ncbi:MAG: DUF427 domain-containing protein [Acidimicrobiia bacterium]
MAETTTQQRVRVEEIGKRVRGYLGGELVVDSTRPRLAWELHYPSYYFPEEDVRTELLSASTTTKSHPKLGEARLFNVKGGTKVAGDAAWQYPDSPTEELRGMIRFDFKALDAWFEEEEPLTISPKDPYHRIDVLESSRHVVVRVNGVSVADSRRPRLIFETGLRTRYYLPLIDVRIDLLQPTATSSGCPYKGAASYWSVEAGGEVIDDLAWGYKTPLAEATKLAGLVCFWAEKSDKVELLVDGVKQ